MKGHGLTHRKKTSCAEAAIICPRPLLPLWAPKRLAPIAPDRNVAVGSRGEYVPTVTAAAA